MGVTESVARGIWITRVALDEYDVRGALLVGGSEAIVWDTLSRPRDMRPYLPLINGLDLTIVYSHADWDHIWGTAGLPYGDARIIAQRLTRDRFSTDVPVVLAEKQVAQPGAFADVVLVPPTESFDGEQSLHVDGLTLVLHHLPGHTRDCTVGFVLERGVLLAGDTVETPCPVVPPDADLTAWISALDLWAHDERVRTVIPAHGSIGGRELLLENVAYLQAIAGGRPIDPRGPLTAFYRDTHARNVRWQGSRAGSPR